jgi:hypothetical protein
MITIRGKTINLTILNDPIITPLTIGVVKILNKAKNAPLNY